VADLRSLATGLEAYMVDNSEYPPNEPTYTVVPPQLSTPVAYVTSVDWVDPFAQGLTAHQSAAPGDPSINIFYTYNHIISVQTWQGLPSSIQATIPAEAVHAKNAFEAFLGPGGKANVGAFDKYGYWKLASKGPDRTYIWPASPYPIGSEFTPPLYGMDLLYDPTNGTVSFGNILRSQVSSAGIKR
jgi:hypothetical protein